MHPIDRDARGKLAPVVQPKRWNASSVKRSRERSARIAIARIEAKKRLATAQWLHDLDRRGICELEATGIPWFAVERWLDTMDQRETFAARMVVKQVLQTLADDSSRPAERFEARRELYQRLISSGVID
jgi:hypothetical protein